MNIYTNIYRYRSIYTIGTEMHVFRFIAFFNVRAYHFC